MLGIILRKIREIIPDTVLEQSLPVCSGLRHWMLTVVLCAAVTPPRVNTGLEVSSTDKNTLASQQRGKHARIPLCSPPALERMLHSAQVVVFFI